MRFFLLINSYNTEYKVDDMVGMVLAVESDAWKVDEIDEWLRTRTSKV